MLFPDFRWFLPICFGAIAGAWMLSVLTYWIGGFVHPDAKRDDGPYVSGAFGTLAFLLTLFAVDSNTPEWVPDTIHWFWFLPYVPVPVAAYLSWYGVYFLRGRSHAQGRKH